MKTKCLTCGSIYDDAAQFTTCPRDPLAFDEILARKVAAVALIGKEIRFAHQPDGPVHHLTSIGPLGMVRISGMEGEFAPHLFVEADPGRWGGSSD